MKKIFLAMDELGLKRKTELIKLAIYNLAILGLGVGAYFLMGGYLPFIYSFVALLLLDVFILFSYSGKLRKKKAAQQDEFVHLFSFFSIFVANGYNVYQALKEISLYSSILLKNDLDQLIKEIDEDKSLTPYVRFSSLFEDLEIKQVMISIYQMVDEGEKESSIVRFESLFIKYSESNRKATRQKRVSLLSNLSMLPLVGSAISIICLTAGVLEAMGGFYNVI